MLLNVWRLYVYYRRLEVRFLLGLAGLLGGIGHFIGNLINYYNANHDI
jgi:hypothetical protein